MEKVVKKILEEVVNTLILEEKTVSTMESCTGGGLAHYITNIPGCSSVFRLGLATYSNIGKIQAGGVPAEIIDKYTVYSMETAMAMAHGSVTRIGDDYGVGITEKLLVDAPSNPYGESNKVYISIYDASLDKYYNKSMFVTADNREDNKIQVIYEASLMLLQVVKHSKDINMVFASNSDDQQGVTHNNGRHVLTRRQ